jgi:long-chain acyl-CoA synthetase
VTPRVDGLLAAASARWPDGPAIVEQGARITWGELERRVALAAGWLREQGLRAGDRVLVLAPNGITFACALYAALRAGGVVVPGNVAYTPRELAHLLDDAQVRLVIADPAAGRSSMPPGDAVIAYTSGTTGRPKGARLTHANLLANLEAFGNLDRLRLEPGDVLLGILPFSHTFGLNVTLNAAVEAGACVLALERFSPGSAAEAIAATGVTVAYGAPGVYAALAALAERGPVPLPTLRAAVSGADSLPVGVWEAFADRYGLGIMEGYGLTETAPVVATNCASPATRPGTVGHPLPGVRVRIAADDGRDRPTGEEGEILVSGPNVFAGYHGQESATAEILRDGWLRTGDLGRRDADGYLSIVGRLGDVIIVSGFNVYPPEIEQVLSEHPAVAEAAVVGAPDARTGERVCAYVVLRPGASVDVETLTAHCRERLARFKLPRELHVVGDLPHTPLGKLRRAELRRSS